MVFYNLTDTQEYKSGLDYEIKAHNIIKQFEKANIIETCNTADYDFKDSNGDTYEIKNDTISHKTTHFL